MLPRRKSPEQTSGGREEQEDRYNGSIHTEAKDMEAAAQRKPTMVTTVRYKTIEEGQRTLRDYTGVTMRRSKASNEWKNRDERL